MTNSELKLRALAIYDENPLLTNEEIATRLLTQYPDEMQAWAKCELQELVEMLIRKLANL
jgi:hypothetical protein